MVYCNCSYFLGYMICTGKVILGGMLESELSILVVLVPQTLRYNTQKH